MKRLKRLFLARAAMMLLAALLSSATGAWAQSEQIFAGFTATRGSGTSTSSDPQGEGYEKLVDGLFADGTKGTDWTKWGIRSISMGHPEDETGSYYWVDFNSDSPITVASYILTTGNDNATSGQSGRNPKSWVLKAKANENDSWTTIANVTNDQTMKDVNFTDYRFALDVPGTYKYFRFMISETRGATFMQLCELRFSTREILNAPFGLAATLTPGNGTIATLGWTQSGGVAKWQLEYGTASDFTGATQVEVTGTPTKDLTGLTPETTYYARVRAINSDNEMSEWSNVTFTPSNAYSVTVGNGTSTTSSAPLYGNYKSSYVQMIYTASQLQAAGISGPCVINKLGFNSSNTNSIPRHPVIYICRAPGDKSTFSSNTDFVSITEFAKVYDYANHSEWSITAGWNEFELDTPFEYDGTSNLIVAVHCGLIGNYSSTSFYYATTEAYQVIYAYSDSTDPVPATNEGNWDNYSGSKSQSKYLPNLKLYYNPLTGDCAYPTDLAASNITATSAVVSWTSDASSWQICLSGNEDNPTTVNTKSYALTGLTEDTRYTVKVRTVCGEGGYSAWMSKTFTTLEAHPAPSDLAASSITKTSAVLDWTENNGATKWVVAYKENGAADFTEVEANEKPFALTDLKTMTQYTVKVRPYDDDTKWSAEISFTTAAGIPLVEEFSTTSLPTGWSRYSGLLSNGTATLTTTTSGWSFSNSNGVFDNHAKVNIYGTSCKYWLVTPSLLMDDNVQLIFDMALTAYSGTLTSPQATGTDDKFAVLITTNGGTSWTVLRQWDNAEGSEYVYNDIVCSATGQTVALDLSSYAGQTIAIAFYGESTENNADNYLHIDNVSIDYIPDCYKPTDLKVTGITAHSAELSWTANSDESSWKLYWKKASDENYTEVSTGVANPYTLNNLDAATQYTFYVVANCSSDGESDPSKTFTFVTDCETITTFPWRENFDSYTAGNNVLPICWSYINTTTNSTYAAYPRVYANNSYSTYAHSAPNCLYFYSYGNSAPQPQYAILPPMTGLAGMQVMLNAKGYNANSTLKIGTMSDPTDASTFTMIAEQTLSTSYPEEPFEYIIPSDCSDSYLAIMIDAAPSGNNTRGVYVDDIVVREAPTCLKPTGLTVTGVISTNTVTLAWTNGSDDQTAWQICLNGDEENLIMANSNPFTIEGLTAATRYTAKVRAYCSADDQSDWSKEVSFITDCEAITGLPWNENFDAYTGSTSSSAPSGYPNDDMPICWRFLNRSDYKSTYPQVFISSNNGYPVSGKCLFFKSSSSTPLFAVLPEFEEDISGLQLTFTYRNEGTSESNGTLIVGYMTNPADATTFTAVLTCERTTALTENEVLFTEAPAGSYIAFKYEGGSSSDYYLSIDNVKVDVIPTCVKPTDLEVTATTTTTATLSWTENGEAIAWQICLNGDEENLILANGNPFTLEGLTPSTAYTAKVRACCSADDQSSWSNEVRFATDCEDIVVTSSWSEDFEAGDISTCWSQEGDGTWTVGTGDYNQETGAHTGTYNAKITHSSRDDVTKLITPVLDLSSLNNPMLTFWYINRPWDSDIDGFAVYYRTASDAEWTLIEATEEAHVTWTEATYQLPYPSATYQIAFEMTDNWGFGVGIDDIVIYETGHLHLYDNADNSTTINSNNAQLANVTLADRTLYKDGAWNTLCLPFSMTNEQVTAQLAPTELKELDTENNWLEDNGQWTTSENGHMTGLDDDGTLYLNFKDAEEISAGVPYIIKWTSGDNIVNPVFTDVTIDSDNPTEVNFTGGKFTGTYSYIPYTAEDESILLLGDNNTLYWPIDGASIGAFRAYFQLDDANAVRAFRLNFGDGEVQGIISIDNGQLTIDNESGSWYTVDGVKVEKPKRKGLYIQNGRKVVIK